MRSIIIKTQIINYIYGDAIEMIYIKVFSNIITKRTIIFIIQIVELKTISWTDGITIKKVIVFCSMKDSGDAFSFVVFKLLDCVFSAF